MTNPVQYTSRTFRSILADINSDPELVDKPDWFKKIWAGIGDILSIWENFTANNGFLRTAITRRAVADICAMLDYQLSPKLSSSGVVLVDFSPTAPFPFSVLVSDLVATTPGSSQASARRFEARAGLSVSALTEVTASTAWTVATGLVTVASNFTTGEKVRLSSSGTLPAGLSAGTDYYAIRVGATSIYLASSRANAYAGTKVTFSDQGSGNHTITRLSRSVTMYQQTSVDSVVLGQGDGVTPSLEFLIATVGIQPDTVQVVINSVSWTRVDSFIDSGAADTHFKLEFNTDGTAVVVFGDGVYGAIPGSFDIECAYAYGGGSSSNVATANTVNTYLGGNIYVTGVSNPAAMVGGADAESMDRARRLAPMLLKARDRFVTAEDGKALLEAYGGVYQVQVISNPLGPLSAGVAAVAAGGGSPGATERTAMEAYLVSKSIMESVAVTFYAGTFTPVNVTAVVSVKPGYVQADIIRYAKTALRLFFADTGMEIYETYTGEGASAARALINEYFSETYTADKDSILAKMLSQFASIEPRAFGQTITLSDLYTFVQNGIDGLDSITVSSPSFPIALGDYEITTPGTMGVT